MLGAWERLILASWSPCKKVVVRVLQVRRAVAAAHWECSQYLVWQVGTSMVGLEERERS